MIWQSTQKFGCGKARSRSGKVVVVAYYEPKGNIKGLFHENVFPPVIDKFDDDEIIDPKTTTSTNFCDNHWVYVLYVNVINIIIIVILVIVVI